MFDNLFDYFYEEMNHKNSKKELDKKNKDRNRYMYFFAIVFIILLICSIFNII